MSQENLYQMIFDCVVVLTLLYTAILQKKIASLNAWSEFFLLSFSPSVHKTHFHLCLWFCIFPHETRRICQCLRKTDKPMKLSSCDANLLSVLQERHTLLFAFEKNQLLVRIQLRRLYPQKSLICHIPWDDLLTYHGHQILTPGGSEGKVTDSVRRSLFHFWRVSLSVITFFLFFFPLCTGGKSMTRPLAWMPAGIRHCFQQLVTPCLVPCAQRRKSFNTAVYQVSITSPLPHSASMALRQWGLGTALDLTCTEWWRWGHLFQESLFTPWGAEELQGGEITGSNLQEGTCLPRGVGESGTSMFRSCSCILLPSKCRAAQCFLSFDGVTRWTSQSGGMTVR